MVKEARVGVGEVQRLSVKHVLVHWRADAAATRYKLEPMSLIDLISEMINQLGINRMDHKYLGTELACFQNLNQLHCLHI